MDRTLDIPKDRKPMRSLMLCALMAMTILLLFALKNANDQETAQASATEARP